MPFMPNHEREDLEGQIDGRVDFAFTPKTAFFTTPSDYALAGIHADYALQIMALEATIEAHAEYRLTFVDWFGDRVPIRDNTGEVLYFYDLDQAIRLAIAMEDDPDERCYTNLPFDGPADICVERLG